MQKVRFLIPFLIFLVLFLMTSALCYYFANEKQQITDKIQGTQDQIGTKYPVSTQGGESEDEMALITDLSVKSSLFERAVNLRQKTELTKNRIEFGSSEGAQFPNKITGEGEIGKKANLSNVAESMKKNPPKMVDYKKDVEAILSWYTYQQEMLKKFNNIKSQHFIDYSQYTGFEVQDQIAEANALIASLKNTDINDALNSFDIFFNESQDVNRESKRWKQIEAINSYVKGGSYKSDVERLVSEIETSVNKYAEFVNKNGLKISDLHQSREIMFKAYSDCVKLVKMLSIYEATIDGEKATLVLPKISESKAKSEASELLVILHPNDNAFFKRVYNEGNIQPGTNLPTDEFGVANLEFEALIADSMAEINKRRFRTDPAYQNGITLEKILNAQSLTIDTLVEMNRMLKTRLVQVYNTKDPNVALPALPNKMKAEAKAEIKKNADDLTLDIAARINALEARTTNSNDRRDDLLMVQSEIAELADSLREEYEKLDVPLRKAIAEHKQRLESLERQFINLKRQVGDDIRSEGKLRPSQGEDGVISFTDKLNDKYNINLGRADKIVPGMRFLVYNETGGKINAKGIIEVLDLRQDHFANCGLIVKYPNADILKGDKISNPFFRKVNGKSEFLTVAFIGKFEPPESNISNAQMKVYLRELGVKVMDEPDSSTDLIILAKPISKLEIRTRMEKSYIEDLRPKIRFDEIEIKDILIYFQDQ